jgi:hypothetical protein
MKPVMERRLRQLRSRVLVRSWAYRQRRHAHGAWFELRLVLAQAAEAYVVSAEDVRRLVEDGHRPEPAGDALQPPKVIVFATPERGAHIAGARQVPVRLGGDLLAADHLVLVPFARPATVRAASPSPPPPSA